MLRKSHVVPGGHGGEGKTTSRCRFLRGVISKERLEPAVLGVLLQLGSKAGFTLRECKRAPTRFFEM